MQSFSHLYNLSCKCVNNSRCLTDISYGITLPIMKIGERLKLAREKAKLTQGQLAEKTGVSQQTISKLETGKSDSTSEVVQLAAVLAVSPEWLVTGEDPLVTNQLTVEEQAIIGILRNVPEVRKDAFDFIVYKAERMPSYELNQEVAEYIKTITSFVETKEKPPIKKKKRKKETKRDS